ncbi:MAG: DUF4143 domain-containing protein [Deltaproteobacteria bacterium]|nr:DUF4143 domain-containing protein [Deltaproteobacteria bacterium]
MRPHCSSVILGGRTLQQAFLLWLITQFTGHAVRQKASSPKILPTCPARISACLTPERALADRSLRGRIIDSIVGNALRESFTEVYYWKKRHDEVDFIVRSGSRVITIEVKYGRERK